MQIEETKQLKLTLPTFEVRAGNSLPVIELMNGNKSTGRELTFRYQELESLITALQMAKDHFKPA